VGVSGSRVHDLLVLALVVFLPATVYLPGLGFYSDDWNFLQVMAVGDDAWTGPPFWEPVARLFPTIDLRPAHAVYVGLRYAAFGQAPLGYHVVNHLVILATLAMLVVVLRRLGLSRSLAMVTAIIYGLMPSYATLRFWMVADNQTLSLLLYLVSLWADLRGPSGSLGRTIGWRLLSAVAAFTCTMLHELSMPLLLVNPFVGWWYRQGRPGWPLWERGGPDGVEGLAPRVRVDWRLVIDLAVNATIVLAAAIYKSLSPRAVPDPGVTLLGRLLRLARGVLNHHVITNGVAEPLSIWTILTRYFDPWALLVGVICGVGAGLYVYWLLGQCPLTSPAAPPRQARRHLLLVAALGLVVLGLGYAIFVTNDQFYFSAAGTYTRIAQIGSLGVALMLAGGFGLLATLAPRPTTRQLIVGVLVGVYGGAGVLIVTTVGGFWDQAYVRERAIVADLQRSVPTLAPGSALLLDGECPYIGPAVVFESDWDLQGVLRLLHHDPSLRANVVTPRLEVHDDTVTTWLTVPSATTAYPYASGLVVYNRPQNLVVPIESAADMNEYLARHNPDRGDGCPFGWSGNGVTILPRPLQ
jgi:hypothetical protein